LERYNWSRLNSLQLGRYAEYFVKMEFTLFGFDIYSSEVDDRGIDFVIRKDVSRYYDVQVKSLLRGSYIFMLQDKFILSDNLLAAIVLFADSNPPQLYLIPSKKWEMADSFLVRRDYGQGKKSKPEWGINLSKRNLPLLEVYKFDKIVQDL
jgi:hypothetical protein